MFNRHAVQAALRSLQAKLPSRTPANGLAAFADGDTGARIVEPTCPCTLFLYRCDKNYHEDELLQMQTRASALHQGAETDVFTLLHITGHGFSLHRILRDDKAAVATLLARKQWDLPNRTRRGGQSQHRYERINDGAKQQRAREAAEACRPFVRATWFLSGTVTMTQHVRTISQRDSWPRLSACLQAKTYDDAVALLRDRFRGLCAPSLSDKQESVLNDALARLARGDTDAIVYGPDAIEDAVRNNLVRMLFSVIPTSENITIPETHPARAQVDALGGRVAVLYWVA